MCMYVCMAFGISRLVGGCISGHWGAVIFAVQRGCSGMFEMIDDLQDRCEY